MILLHIIIIYKCNNIWNTIEVHVYLCTPLCYCYQSWILNCDYCCHRVWSADTDGYIAVCVSWVSHSYTKLECLNFAWVGMPLDYQLSLLPTVFLCWTKYSEIPLIASYFLPKVQSIPLKVAELFLFQDICLRQKIMHVWSMFVVIITVMKAILML